MDYEKMEIKKGLQNFLEKSKSVRSKSSHELVGLLLLYSAPWYAVVKKFLGEPCRVAWPQAPRMSNSVTLLLGSL